MYQVALLLHPEERSRQRVWNAKRSLQELSARTEMLDADGERQAQLQHAIAQARQALGAVTELGKYPRESTSRMHLTA